MIIMIFDVFFYNICTVLNERAIYLQTMKKNLLLTIFSLILFCYSHAASRYWIGGTGNWSDITHWSTASGGAGGATVPVAADNVFFDNNSGLLAIGNTVTMDAAVIINNFDFSVVANSFTLASILASIEIRGSLLSNGLANITYVGVINMYSATALSGITSNGQIWGNTFNFTGSTSANGVTLNDNLNTTQNINITQGLVTAISRTITCANYSSTNGGNRTLNFTGSTFNVTGTTWLMIPGTAPNPLVWTSPATINLQNTGTVTFTGASLTYAILNSNAANLTINSSNTFTNIILPNSTILELGNGTTTTASSLTAQGTCTSPFILEAVDVSLAAATLSISTSPWNSQGLAINKVNASGPTIYNVSLTDLMNSTGWTLSPSKLYWIGNGGNWNDINHWSLSSGGAVSGCLPSSADSVFFDALSFSLANQIVLVDDTAFFKSMDWTGISAQQFLTLDSNIMAYGNIVLNSNLSVNRNIIGSGIQFNRSAQIDINTADVDCNFLIATSTNGAIVSLNDQLDMSDSSSILIFNGNFQTNGNNIATGSIISIDNPLSATDGRGLSLGSSFINLKQKFSTDNDAVIVFSAGTSEIYIGDTLNYGNDLLTEGLIFYNVTLDYDPLQIGPFVLQQKITGNNTFNKLRVTPGSHLFLDSAGTQIVSDSLVLKGNCMDRIYISSTDTIGAINQANLSKASALNVVAECLNLKGINASNAALTTLFSNNNGSNTNWVFSATPAVTANFTVNGPYCFGDTTLFSNISTAISGNVNDIISTWFFNDGTTGYYANPPTDSTWITSVSDTNAHVFPNGGSFNVTLITTYTNFCTDTLTQNVTIYKPELYFNTSDIDKSICEGNSVTFEAGSALTGMSYEFFLNGVSLNIPSPTDTLYTTSLLNDNDTISVLGYQGGCVSDTMPQFIFNVNPTPIFSWTVSDADTSICAGDLVTFDATSIDPTYTFRYRKNNANVTGYTLAGLFSTTTIVDSDTIALVGQSIYGCRDTIDMIFNVDPLPVTSLVSSVAGAIICQNQSVTFTANGANTYEFFIDGVSQQGPSATATWSTTALNNFDTVYVIGYNTVGACSFKATQLFTYTFLPLPVVTMTDSDADNAVCGVDNVTFTASGAAIYTFYVNGVAQFGPTALNTYTTTLNNNDAIYVDGAFGGCTTSTTPVIFTVNTSPTTSLSSSDADNSICQNTSVLFTASGATNYQFFINGTSQGPSSAVGTLNTSTLTNGQTISVVGESNGCFVSDDLIFTVLPLPSVNLFSNDPDNTICQGGSITLTGANAISYQLFVNGIAQGGVQPSPTFTNPTLTTGANSIYVTGTGSNGCSANSSPAMIVTVNPNPIMTLSSSDADNTICAGQSLTFSASGSTYYQFMVNGIPQGSLTTTTSFSTSGITNGQSVTVLGSTLGCTSVSLPIVTTVNAIPIVQLTNNDANNVFCSDQLVTFTSTGATNYEFFVNSVSQGPSSPSNTINSGAFASGTNTVLVVGNTNNCTNSSTNVVTVNALPTATITSSDADDLICAGTSVTFSAGGGNQYQFYINGVPTGGLSTISNYTSSTLLNGNVISVDVLSGAGCQSFATESAITVNATPTVTLTSSDFDQTVCVGENVDFTFSGATDYEYFINSISQGPASAVTTFSSTTLMNGDDIYVIGSTSGCPNNSVTLSFTVFGPPAVNLINNGDNLICTGEATNLNATGALNYQYLINGIPVSGFTPVATYNGTVNNGDIVSVIGEANGCTMASTGSISYTVYTFPVLSSTSSDADNVICLNDAITFTASNGMTYEFSVNGNMLQSGSGSNYTNSNLLNGDVVNITAFNGDCPSTPDTYTFTVNSMNLDLAVSPSSLVCEGSTVVFMASGANQYEFFLNGVSQGAMSATNTLTSSNISDEDEITFNGYSTTTLCSQDLNNYILMNVISEPTITPSAGPDFCEGDSIILTSNQSYGNQWYLNGSPIASATDTSYVVFASGSYSLESTLGGNGNVWSFGWNATGILGDETNFNNPNPTIAVSSESFDELSSGADFILGVTTLGTVFSWGENNSGQLGDGTYTASNLPQAVPTLSNIKTVATTESSSMAVSNTGATYVWGNNTVGQLATGNTSVINFPYANPALTNVDSIAAGKQHFVILKNDGTVWSVGNNSFGQLGSGNLINSATANQIGGLANIISVGAGEYHSFAINNIGDLYVWGNNGSGQLGLNDINGRLIPTISPLKNIINAQGGAVHSAFLSSDNKVYTTGGNQYGQLGTTDLIDRIIPTEVGVTGAAMISAGQYTTLIKRLDNSVFGMGNNTEDQLSSSNGNAISIPEQITDLEGVTFVEASNLSSHFIFGISTSCVSISMNLNMIPVTNVTITAVGDVLSTVPGTAYQWYFNGNIIGGANAQSFTATTAGYYSVEVTFGGSCTGVSADYPYNIVGISDLTNDVKVYPNPTNGVVHMELSNNYDLNKIIIVIQDMSGRITPSTPLMNGGKIDLDLSAYAEGFYIVEIFVENESISRFQLLKTQ